MSRLNRYLGYLAAPGAVTAATLLRLTMSPLWGDTRFAFHFYFCAVAVVAWLSGFGPGLLTLLLSVPAAYFFFVQPVRTITVTSPEDAWGLFSFAVIGLLIIFLADAQKRAMHRVEEAGRALAASEERMATTLTSIGDAVLVTDERGRVTMMNPLAEALTGWSEAEARGKGAQTIFDLRNEETGQEAVSPVARVLNEERAVNLARPALLRRRDGTEIPIEENGAPVRGADGNLTGVVLAFRDISERRAAERRRAFLAGLTERTAALAGPEAVAWEAVRSLGEFLGASRCHFVEVDEGDRTLTARRDWTRAGVASIVGTYPLSTFSPAVLDPLRSGDTLILPDTEADERITCRDREVYRAFGNRSVVNVPIRKDGRWVGTLAVNDSRPRTWTPKEAELLRVVAERTWLAVENARLRRRDHAIAEGLQAALQPPLPASLPGLTLAERYRPALSEANIGGDFCDAFAVGEGFHALVVADVSGKGLAAAAQIATVRHMLRTLLYQREISAAAAVTRLNDILTEHPLLTGFATLFVGAYDVDARTLTYVNAGQEPGLLWRAASDVVEGLWPTGPVLGSFPAATFEERVVTLANGDVLALFTDGLTEAGLNRKCLLGVPGVTAIFRRATERAPVCPNCPSVREVTARVMAAVEELATPAGLRDDICLLVARVEA
jgi:PAS domain S-box-containing protein